MIRRIIVGLAFAAAIFLPAAALSQAVILQAGPASQGHVPMYATPSQVGGQPVVLDSGPAGGGPPGVGLSELNITARGTGTPPIVGQGTGPNGEVSCVMDAPINNPTGYHYLCFSANVGGNGLVSYGSGGTATPGSLTFLSNGSPITPGGGVEGPSSSMVGNIATWNNTAGTLLKDSGVQVDTSGRLLIGNYYSDLLLAPTGTHSTVQIVKKPVEWNISSFNFANDTAGVSDNFVKSRNATPGGQTIVQNNDGLMGLNGWGSDGVAFQRAGWIRLFVDGVPALDSVPGRIMFGTTPVGSSDAIERMRIDNLGLVTLGGSGSANTFGSQLEIVADATLTNHLTQIDIGNNASGNSHFFLKTRGATPSSQVIVQNGDDVGTIDTRASDGVTWRPAANILAQIDAAPGAGSMPGRWVFRTSPTGSIIPHEVMRLDSNQTVTIAPSGSMVGYTNTFGSRLEVAADPTIVSHLDLLAFGGNSAPAGQWFLKTRGTTPSTQTIVQNNDLVGAVLAKGSDGVAFQYVGDIKFTVDGSPGAGSMPGRLTIETTPSASTTPVERLRIDNAGHLFLYSLATTPGSKQPLCIDTSTKQVYAGSGGVC